MKWTNAIYILIFLLGFSSCSEDFLDVDSRENIESDDSQQNIKPEAYVNGVYGMFTRWEYAFSYLGITEIISDNADKGSSPSDQGGDKLELDNLTFTSTGSSVKEMWSVWYKTIGRANYAISYARNFGLDNPEYEDRLVGEARFLRALTYFHLVRSFGPVPLQHEAGESSEGDFVFDLAYRSPVEDCYRYIVQDLKYCIEALPQKSEYGDKDLGRATQGAAEALLAKVFLYQENYEKALEHANNVINSGEYGLEEDYATLWRRSTENGVESIFEIQGRGESIAHGVQQYSQTQGARGSGGWGWGFNTPSENLLEAFNAAGDDIRRDATIIFRGETLWDGREVSASAENAMYNEKAYSSANAGSSDTDKNIRVLRLAEIYLIKAEAANELGQTGVAQEALNMVRNRVELDDVTISDQDGLRKAIWNERRLELAFEHDRWFDLNRTGQAKEAFAKEGKEFEEGKHNLLPIPENQLVQTPEMEQNPGY